MIGTYFRSSKIQKFRLPHYTKTN